MKEERGKVKQERGEGERGEKGVRDERNRVRREEERVGESRRTGKRGE